MGRLTENSVLTMKNTSFSLTAQLVVPESGAEGVIVAQGGVIGGHSLYAKDGKPKYATTSSASSATTSREPRRSRRATTRCAWSSPTTAAASARAATATLYIDGVAGRRRAHRPDRGRSSSQPTRPATSGTSSARRSPPTTASATFTGEVEWVEIELGADDHNHLIKPEDRVSVAMGIQ